eukprot:253328-Amphidinium_carterae.2
MALQSSQICYCYWQHYGYSYVDQYDEIEVPDTRPVQACRTSDLVHPVTPRQWGGLVLLGIVAGWRLLLLVGTGFQLPIRCARHSFELLVRVAGDIRDIGHIIITAYCDTVLVLSKRTPCKRCARRRVLAFRARHSQPIHYEEGDILIMIGTDSDEGLVYRPLSSIQAGGAHWGGRRRWPCIKNCNRWIAYNPRTNGECLFQSLAHIASGAGMGASSTRALRKLAQLELRLALLREDEIEGRTIPQWARLVGTMADRLIDSVTGKHRRWGNTSDALLLAKALNLSIRIIDGDNHRTLMSHRAEGARQRTIVWSETHFFVLHKMRKKPTEMDRQDQGAPEYSLPSFLDTSSHQCDQGHSLWSSTCSDHSPCSRIQPYLRLTKIQP